MLKAAVLSAHHKGVRGHVNLLSVFDVPCWEQFQVTNGQAGTVSLRHTNVSWLGLIAVDCSMWSCETAGLCASKASPMSSLSLILSPCSPIIPRSSDWSGHRVTCLSPSELPHTHNTPFPQKCSTDYKARFCRARALGQLLVCLPSLIQSEIDTFGPFDICFGLFSLAA